VFGPARAPGPVDAALHARGIQIAHDADHVGRKGSDASGSTTTPESPATSGKDEQFEAITGAPRAIASSTGKP
jgi:hypothetical protein